MEPHMCGIIGYVGFRPAPEFLIDGLRRLEYRGYDSAGIAVQHDGKIGIRKRAGQVDELDKLVEANPVEGSLGIGHTRWATHGETTDLNSHPHVGGNGEVVIVHNGVIENYVKLREQLQMLGYVFRTSTDSEIIAHMVCQSWLEQIKLGGDPQSPEICLKAIQVSVERFKGTYGIAAVFRDVPDVIIAARMGSPLVVGIGKDRNEHFIASDASPLVGYTEEVFYINDHEIAVVTPEKVEVHHAESGRTTPSIHTLDQESADIELGDFEHYMLKEIFEQPDAIENCLRGRIDEESATARFGGLNLDPRELRQIDRIVFTACGTSWHAGLVGEYLFEEVARIPTEVEYASELRYRNPPANSRAASVLPIAQTNRS